ncbi:MAG TPA: hypothetical protein VE422_08255 [Terriglobia bacterium]|nr:hypothetical protein [Terriglobia bacterium]
MTLSAFVFILLFQGGTPVPPGVVTGQLRTIDGAPAIAVRVAAMPVPVAAGNSILADGVQYYTAGFVASTALTDVQGRYRLTNIPPGRYYIMAGAIGEATYYPATTESDSATPVAVASGSTTPNMDFKLLRRFGGRVSGRVNPNTNEEQTKATLLGGKLEEILEVSVARDGAFEFGHVPPGKYLLGLFPRPAGLASLVVNVGDADVTGLQLVPPPTRAVTGRIVVQNGPLPHALLEFSSPQGYAGATIRPDGTFTARLQQARHKVDLAGMQVGYSVVSVRIGSEDASQGFVVGNADLSGLVITVAAPRRLPRVRGTIAGLPPNRLASTRVQIAGPIMGSLEARVQPDGSFEFPAVIPGLYNLRLPEAPELAPINVVVASWDTVAEVRVDVTGR